MQKTVTMWMVLIIASVLTSCASHPAGSSCPEWVHPSPALTGQLDDAAFEVWAVRHNRNYRCFCLGEAAFCAQ